MNNDKADFIPVFDGQTLAGWHSVPRLPVSRAPGESAPDPGGERYRRAMQTAGKWTVEDGAIVGRQDPPGSSLGGIS